MKFSKIRILLAMTLGLAATACYAPVVKADAINYSTVGSVDTPTGGIANMVYFNGLSNGTLDPVSGIDIGQFQVSSLSGTTGQTYSSTPFHIQVYSGGNQGDQINGVLNGIRRPGRDRPADRDGHQHLPVPQQSPAVHDQPPAQHTDDLEHLVARRPDARLDQPDRPSHDGARARLGGGVRRRHRRTAAFTPDATRPLSRAG